MRTSFSANDMIIHRIVEQESGFTPMLDFLPTLSKETLGENLAWLAPGGYDSASGNVVLCFQSYVVKTPHHNILIDSCIGNDKNFPLRPTWNKKTDSNWMGALKAAGLGVEDIDFVMCTHLHGDQAVRTRRNFLERYCDTDTLCCTMHFPSPSVGHIKRWGDGFRLEYAKG